MSKNMVLISVLILSLLAQLSLAQGQTCCKNNQIQVTGQGTASALPDMATINLRFNEKGKTSAEAVKALSNKVNQALAILNANGLNNDAYETGSINVYPEYSNINGQSQVIGQQAQQTLAVKIYKVDSNGVKVGSLVDALAAVNGINIDSIVFDIFDKSPLQTKARAKAFQNAKDKAQDYASFAGLNLGRVLTVDDSSVVSGPPIALKSAYGARVAADTSTVLPVGQQDFQYSMTITFALR